MNFPEIFTMIWQTLSVALISSVLAYCLGLPVGILLHITSSNGIRKNKIVNAVVGVIVNILRSIPCLIIIVLCIPWTRAWFGKGTGEWFTIIIPLTVCAFGFVARMVEQSLAEVPVGEIEAVKSLGASDLQIIFKVLLPEARSSLITGSAVVIVNVIGYTAFSYNIGAGGLISGVYTYYTRHTGNYLEATYFWLLIVLIVVIVQLIQELGLILAKKLDKRIKKSK